MNSFIMPALLLFGLCAIATADSPPSSPSLPPAVVIQKGGQECPRSHPSPSLPPAMVIPKEVHEISPEQVERQLVDHPDTLIIDVRTEEERRSRGVMLNSMNFDYFHGQQTLDALAKLDKTKPCILFCAIGGRAQLIAVEMHKLGFKNILLLKGGFNAWTASGQAVAK